jgi:hypothetical protein
MSTISVRKHQPGDASGEAFAGREGISARSGWTSGGARARRTRTPGPLPGILAALCSLLLLAGCAVQFVAPYDAVFDQALSALHLDTSAFLGRMNRTGEATGANARFYDDAQGRIAALRVRAQFYGAEKNKGTLRQLDLLADSFRELAELHEAGPLTGEAGRIARELIDSHFRSAQQIELAKKRSSGVTAPTGQP